MRNCMWSLLSRLPELEKLGKADYESHGLIKNGLFTYRRLLQVWPSGQVTPPLPSESESMVHVNSPRTAFLGEVLNYYCQKYAKKLRLPRATESNTTAAYHMDRLAREAMVVEHHF